ncbi:MAG: superoxide dismutase [Bacteroidetes bacterium]|nr:superoxide dismutase [Bacteroidota bacterium]
MSANRRDFIKTGAAAVGASLLAPYTGLAGTPDHDQARLFALAVNDAGEYTLPPLPYAYEALEPHIDAQTMRLHHDIHHNGYVKGLNAALKGMETARTNGDYALIDRLAQKAAFHGSGHILHAVFWQNMISADKSGTPKGSLKRQIEKDFRSVSAFTAQFKGTAATVEGSGWGILAWEPLGRRLVVLQAEKHQNLTQWGAVPLLVVDVWEHAYYLKYQNKRGEYIDNFLRVVNWDDVANRLEAVMS